MNLQALAQELGGDLIGNPDLQISGVKPLSVANDGDISFVLEKKYLKEGQNSKACALVTFGDIDFPNCIKVAQPRKAMAQTICAILPESVALFELPFGADSQFSVGDNTLIGANVNIGPGVKIGNNCRIFPGVSIYPNVVIGDNVIIHANSVIGSDGFGYYVEDGFHKIPHVGSVEIQDDVEIGGNVVIDRGVLDKTIIGKGSKLDNLVHIAHNAIIGAHCAIAAQVGCLGGAKLGDFVQIGGQTGIADVSIGNNSIVASRAGVTKNIDANKMVSGFPAWDHKKEILKEIKIRQLVNKKDQS